MPWEAIVTAISVLVLILGGWVAREFTIEGKLARIETNTAAMSEQIEKLSKSLMEQVREDREEHREIWGQIRVHERLLDKHETKLYGPATGTT